MALTVPAYVNAAPLRLPNPDQICPEWQCENSKNESFVTPPAYLGEVANRLSQNLAVGARQTMAVMYQSCEVLNAPLYDPFTAKDIGEHMTKIDRGHYKERRLTSQSVPLIARDHYYLSYLRAKRVKLGEKCMDPSQAPPLFIYGARPSFSADGNTIHILQKRTLGKGVATGLDCSAFASVALNAAGLKIQPKVKSASANVVTSLQLMSMNEKNSCFERPTFEGEHTLQMGDMIVMEGHVMIVDWVGEDPFGLKQLKREGLFPKRPEECYGFPIPSDDLNFGIIHSSGFGDMPASRVSASNYIRPGWEQEGALYNRLRDIFEAACLAEFGYKIKTFKRRGSVLLRHKGTPECRFEQKPQIKGMECTGPCWKEALQ